MAAWRGERKQRKKRKERKSKRKARGPERSREVGPGQRDSTMGLIHPVTINSASSPKLM